MHVQLISDGRREMLTLLARRLLKRVYAIVYLLALAVLQGGCFVTLDRGIPLDAVGGALSEHLIVLT